jgi:hypothetical protein
MAVDADSGEEIQKSLDTIDGIPPKRRIPQDGIQILGPSSALVIVEHEEGSHDYRSALLLARNNLKWELRGRTDELANARALRTAEQDLDLWKHHAAVGGEDKNRMVAITTLLLGFSGGLLGYLERALRRLHLTSERRVWHVRPPEQTCFQLLEMLRVAVVYELVSQLLEYAVEQRESPASFEDLLRCFIVCRLALVSRFA